VYSQAAEENATHELRRADETGDGRSRAEIEATSGEKRNDMHATPTPSASQRVGRSPTAARQLASRARRRVQGTAPVPDADLTRQREVVDAFLAASRDGDFDALLGLLDPDVVLRADRAAVHAGASREVRGAPAVPTPSRGVPGSHNRHSSTEPREPCGLRADRPRVVFGFTITGGKIVEIDLLADPERLRQLDLAILND